MSRGPIFVKQDVFEEHLRRVPVRGGGEYADMNTIYGDMSRLVVAWLATAPASELVERYEQYGWGGSPAVRAIQEAARDWLKTYHPDRSVTRQIGE